MKASIIIPCYNSEKTINLCLNSLLNQTFKEDYEIIFVDDGSTDKTKYLIEESRKKNKNIKLIEQQHAGPAVARNLGAKTAKYDILVFTDSDCEAEKNWLEEMVKPFSDPKVVAVQGAYKTKQKSEIANFIQLEIEERYVRMKRANHLDWIGSYSAAYKKDIYLKEGGFDSKFEIASGEDSDLSYRLSEKGLKLMFNPKAIVYHAHAESLENYLKKKFGHAYWRVTLYSKHRQKMMKDSYTPQELKLQLIAISIFIVSLILSPFNLMFAHLALTAFIISIVLMLKTAKFMFDRNPTIGFISVPILFLRDLSLIFGFGFGLLNKKSK
ncbi:MAG: hypothetical protein COT15_01735 [Candidatus Diapherotrites archaeon CG08_land_8_20_14_0_20_34_12]|nr:MAG: hypothetical protein COT15_01735 [Candidatus Diapherotrites archaeon CG08_land_8_20_14_0_20_34_12]